MNSTICLFVAMIRLLLTALVLVAVGGFADPIKYGPHTKISDKTFLTKQMNLLSLYYHIQEPNHEPEQKTISETWSLEQNLKLYGKPDIVKIYVELMKFGRILPRHVPFAVYLRQHQDEAKYLYTILMSAKNYDTFYKTAVYFRDRVNESLFVYVLAIATLNYPETQGIYIPPIFEVFPSYFHNSQIMTTAQRLNTHGKHMMEYYPGTYVWEDNVVIQWNGTVWPYYNKDFPLSYFTHDYHLQTLYYNYHLSSSFWLSAAELPSVKYGRGEYLRYIHKLLVARYYMERLSNGLGEIPELDFNVVQQGYSSGLLYPNGIPLPSRPNHFDLDQPLFTDYIAKIKDYESRIRNAIDLGYVFDKSGKQISIRTPEAIDIIGSLIEGNQDSVNPQYYRDFIGLWKYLLGNAITTTHEHVNGYVPLVVPSVLENYQTALRDPAFYMIWKRVLKLFDAWSSYLPRYTPHELDMPNVQIEKVHVDKLVTFFENVYLNVTNHLHMSEEETKVVTDDVQVLVQRPVINHKPFQIRLHVKSEVAQKVLIKFFLAPKYDSMGVEIPLHVNTQNFFLMDTFVHELKAGENIVTRESNENALVIDTMPSAYQVYQNAFNAYNGNGDFVSENSNLFFGFPRRLMIPKGRIGGMPFVFMVYINEKVSPKDGVDTNSSNSVSPVLQQLSDCLFDYPLDRPLYSDQVATLKNIYFQDVNIYHKPTPEMYNPFK